MELNARAWKVIIVTSIFQLLTTLAVSSRIYARVRTLHNAGIDEWIICAGRVSHQ